MFFAVEGFGTVELHRVTYRGDKVLAYDMIDEFRETNAGVPKQLERRGYKFTGIQTSKDGRTIWNIRQR
jgi:hypothetical protein